MKAPEHIAISLQDLVDAMTTIKHPDYLPEDSSLTPKEAEAIATRKTLEETTKITQALLNSRSDHLDFAVRHHAPKYQLPQETFFTPETLNCVLTNHRCLITRSINDARAALIIAALNSLLQPPQQN